MGENTHVQKNMIPAKGPRSAGVVSEGNTGTIGLDENGFATH
jgi:hypothetical protein